LLEFNPLPKGDDEDKAGRVVWYSKRERRGAGEITFIQINEPMRFRDFCIATLETARSLPAGVEGTNSKRSSVVLLASRGSDKPDFRTADDPFPREC
jgi:hypothetical protein